MFVNRKQICTFMAVIAAVIYPVYGVLGFENNQTPVIESIPTQYVLEGEQLNLTVKAIDPEGDEITMGIINRFLIGRLPSILNGEPGHFSLQMVVMYHPWMSR